MLRRLSVIAVLVVLLSASSGVAAGNFYKKKITITPVLIDTTDYVFGGQINDTLGPFTSDYWTWGVGHEFSEIVGRIWRTSLDTAFEDDSVTFNLETKFDSDYDSTWRTIWTSGLITDAGFEAANAMRTISVPVDSIPSMGDLFRLTWTYHAEEDSMSTHAQASSTAGYLDLAVAWQAYITFRLR